MMMVILLTTYFSSSQPSISHNNKNNNTTIHKQTPPHKRHLPSLASMAYIDRKPTFPRNPKFQNFKSFPEVQRERERQIEVNIYIYMMSSSSSSQKVVNDDLDNNNNNKTFTFHQGGKRKRVNESDVVWKSSPYVIYIYRHTPLQLIHTQISIQSVRRDI